MDVNNTQDFDIPEFNFDDPVPQEAQGTAPSEPVPTPQTQVQPQTPSQPQSVPQPQTASVLGPATARVQQELEAVKARYAALAQQRKAFEESGLGVPAEVQEELNRLLVRQEALSIALNDAKRSDAMARIPSLVQQGLATLPANWARAVKPYYEQVLQNAIAANPDVVHDPITLNYLLNLAIGAAQRDALARKAQPQHAQGVYTPPPAPKGEAVSVPDEVRAYGVSEETWKRVSAQKASTGGYYELDW